MLVVGNQPLKHGEQMLAPGTPLPEAESWPHLEALLSVGRLVRKLDAPRKDQREERSQKHGR